MVAGIDVVGTGGKVLATIAGGFTTLSVFEVSFYSFFPAAAVAAADRRD